MKKILILLIPAAFLFSSCDKDPQYNAEFNYADKSDTYLKFINAYSYASPVFAGQSSASVQLTYSGIQFSGTPIGLGGAFPANPNYANVRTNITQKEMFVRLALGVPPAATRDSFLFSFVPNLNFGKYYSIFWCDSINNLNKRLLITEDDVREPGGQNLYRIRFINLIPNMPVATPALDLFSFRARAVIFSGIPSRGVTPFIELPVQGVNVSDTLQIRYTGSSTPLATLNGLAITGQSSITVFARGFVGASSPRNPAISSYRNR